MNINGFYNGFVQQLKQAEQDGMLYAPASELMHVVETLDELKLEISGTRRLRTAPPE